MKFAAGIVVILLLIGSVFFGGLLVSGNMERMVYGEDSQIENYEGIEKETFPESNHIGYKDPFLERNMEGSIGGIYRSELLEEKPITISRPEEKNFDIEKMIEEDYIPRVPIRIDGNDEFHEKAAENDWPGDGSEEHPYIIEGYDIDGEGYDHGIHITGTTVYFEVKNSHIHNADYDGVKLNTVENGGITNNIIAENGDRVHAGVSILFSERNTVSKNIISNHQFDGIYVSSSNNNRITNNTITHNEINGIRLWGADSNTIADNDIISNGMRAIFIRESKYIVISNNTMEESGIDFLGPEGGYGDPGDVGYWNTHEIYTNNTVNGRPVYYWKNKEGGTVPTGAGQVILGNCQNVTVKDQNITGGTVGIVIGYSRKNTIVNNTIADVHHGISLKNSESSSIDQGNEIIDNTILNTSFAGMYFFMSSFQSLKNNTMGRQGGIFFRQTIDWTEREHWTTHLIDPSNTVNGRPIYYWSNKDEGTVPTDAGQVILAGSEDVTVKNQNLNGVVAGIVVGYSDNIAVIDNTASETSYGIFFVETDDSAITNNQLSNNNNGIRLHDKSKYNRIADNIAYNNSNRGVLLGSNSDSNTLVNNTMKGNDGTGISVLFADWNTIYHNRFIDNKYHANFIGFSAGNNEWNKPYPKGGNYWDDHTEPDEYSGPGQDEPGSDGIVDISRDIPGSRRKDRYPWTNPRFTSPVNISNPAPVDDATDIALDTTLSVSVEAVSHPVEVEFYLNGQRIYDGTVENDSRVETKPLELKYNTTYDWKVEATNDEGANWTVSPIYSFTTGTEEPRLTIEVEEGGTTEPGPGTYIYGYGEEAVIEALPDEGWKFHEWTGDISEGEEKDEKVSIVMTEDRKITAHFEELEKQKLVVNIEGNGSVEVDGVEIADGWSREYYQGMVVELGANPADGWFFEGWTGDYEGTDKSITIMMDDDMQITAVFEDQSEYYELELNIEGKGEVEIDPEQDEYKESTKVTLTAVPEEGWLFIEWRGDYEGTDEQINVTMEDDMHITAVFEEEIEYYELTVNVEGEGTVEVEPDQEEYEHGTEVTLTAVPAEESKFVEWSGDETSIEVEITVTMDEDKTITAHFEKLAPAEFEFSALTVEPEEPELGEEVEISVDVTNVGDIEGEYTVEFYVNDALIDEVDVELEAGETETVSTTYEIEEAGEYHMEAEGLTLTIDVEDELEPTHFEVEITAPGDSTEFDEGDDVTVEYIVENTGDEKGTQNIVFSVDGAEEGTEEVTLESGEDWTGSFSWSADEVGNHTLEIASDDTSDTISITVEEDDDDPGFLSDYWWLIVLMVIVMVIAIVVGMRGYEKKVDVHTPKKEKEDDEED